MSFKGKRIFEYLENYFTSVTTLKSTNIQYPKKDKLEKNYGMTFSKILIKVCLYVYNA